MNIYEVIYGPGFEADIAQVKSIMVVLLVKTLRERYVGREQMAAALQCSKTQISNIMTGKLGSLSFERLARYLSLLGLKPKAVLDDASLTISLGPK